MLCQLIKVKRFNNDGYIMNVSSTRKYENLSKEIISKSKVSFNLIVLQDEL